MSLKFPKIERSRSSRLGRSIAPRRKIRKKKKGPGFLQSTSSSSMRSKNIKLPKRPSSSSKIKKKKEIKPSPYRHNSETDIGDTTVDINDLLYPELEDSFEMDDADLSVSSGYLNNNFFLTEVDSKDNVDEDDFKRREIVVDGVPLKDLQKKREDDIEELSTYLNGLKEMKDSSGEKLIDYPENYDKIVNVLMNKPTMTDVQLQNYIDAGSIKDLDPFEPIEEENFKKEEKREMMKIRKLDLILEELECKLDEKEREKGFSRKRIVLPPFTI